MAPNRVSGPRCAQSRRLGRRLGLLLAAAAFVWLGVSPLGHAKDEESHESWPSSGEDSPKHPKTNKERESWNEDNEGRHDDDEKPPVLLRPPPTAPPLSQEPPPVINVGPPPQDSSLDQQIDTLGDLLQPPKDGVPPTKSPTPAAPTHPVPPAKPPTQTSTAPPAPATPTSSRVPCPLAEECEKLHVAAENAEEWARSLRRAAVLAAEEQRWSDAQAAGIDDTAGKDRDYIATLRRQAADWRQLAADARADAKVNWERNRKFPGQGWDYWARRDEEAAAERDANAERIEQDIARVENKVTKQGEESTALRNAAAEAEQRAVDAETTAAAARRAYEACLERMKQECPPAAGTTTTTTTGGGSTTGTTTSGGGGDGDGPRDSPPPTSYGEEIDDGICPQRDGNHKECVALVIDIMKNDNWRPGSLTDSKEYLEQMGCDLDYVAPTFHTVPRASYVVEKEIWSWSKMEWVTTRYWVNTAASRERPLYHNRLQMAEVNAAIERHRAKLRAGAIMGIEMVDAHGSKPSPESEPCGRLGPSADFWGASGIPRKEFHAGNYAAAKGNVCIWHVVEMSCYSWQAARAVDELSNYGTTECSSPSGTNRSFHAGYEHDVAHTCGKQGLIEICSNYGIAYLEDDINDVWEDEVGRREDPGYDHTNAFTQMLPDLDKAADSSVVSFSTYVDQGYEMCVPPDHTRIGPYWNGP